MIGAYYDTVFTTAQDQGLPIEAAADLAAAAFLDGKPAGQGKRKSSGVDRHAAFWASRFLRMLPAQTWQQESLGLALARYLGQDRFACPDIVSHVAALAPEVLQQAARHAGLVLRQDSPRWREIEAVAGSHPGGFSEFVKVFRIFRQAHRLRVHEVERLREPLASLTPLDLLAYTSLYGFEHLLPGLQEARSSPDAPDTQAVWDAVEDIMAWKLATCDAATLRLTDTAIAASMRQHLTPFLFPSNEEPGPRHDLYAGFTALLDAQIELNAFISRSAEAFSYDDGVRFVRRGERLEIIESMPRHARHGAAMATSSTACTSTGCIAAWMRWWHRPICWHWSAQPIWKPICRPSPRPWARGCACRTSMASPNRSARMQARPSMSSVPCWPPS